VLPIDIVAKKRFSIVANIKKNASREQPVVLVGTFSTMSAGWDDLQRWLCFMVMFGEPMRACDKEQAINRVWRQNKGDQRPVHLYDIRGPEINREGRAEERGQLKHLACRGRAHVH
jgi:hypothetical protein